MADGNLTARMCEQALAALDAHGFGGMDVRVQGGVATLTAGFPATAEGLRAMFDAFTVPEDLASDPGVAARVALTGPRTSSH